MDNVQLYRTALDAMYFLLKNLPEDFFNESTKIVLQKVVTDLFTAYRKEYVIED